MEISTTSLKDVILIASPKFRDDRGHFFESFNSKSFKALNLPFEFVQDNQSFSKKGVIRGLHFQNAPYSQGKLVRVISGKVLDVALDLRLDSPTFGEYELFELDDANANMVYIPEGFAHGFAALEDTVFQYKCTSFYNKDSEHGIRWDDSTLNIPWGIEEPIVSLKDQQLPTFNMLFNK